MQPSVFASSYLPVVVASCLLVLAVAGGSEQEKKLNIGLLVVGTTGDVNPMVAIGLRLKADGHHVRFSTHLNFKDEIERYGFEFAPIAGDAKVLAQYAVSIKADMISSSWVAMTAPNALTNATFTPDAIIATPACFGAFHVAQKLQVPLHYMSVVPWMKTKSFPHILHASLKSNRRGESKANKATRQVPHSFLYSKYLLPRPSDWGQHVRIVGAARLTATQTQGEPSYEPSDELERFLSQGERRPIFIGFGSMILPSPKRFCDDVVRAATAANTNVLLQAGWSNFNDCKPNENVFIMGPAPHAWLFPRVSAVVHHGGAGTTASGLYAGKPTMIVPFFGDQFLWAVAVEKAKVGIAPAEIGRINANILTRAFTMLKSNAFRENAEKMRDRMQTEDGTSTAVEHFYATVRRGT